MAAQRRFTKCCRPSLTTRRSQVFRSATSNRPTSMACPGPSSSRTPARSLVARVKEAIRHLAVVGQQQGALGVVVEAPYGKHAPGHVSKEITYRRATLRITQRGDDARRLVQKVPTSGAIDDDRPPVHQHEILRCLDLGAERRHDDPVDRNVPVDDEPLCGAARGDPGAREILLQPLHVALPSFGRGVASK
jgi:hypothetical protein